MSALRQQMTEDMAVRGLAQRTQQAYLKAVERLAIHYGKRPDLLSSRDIQRFVLHLHEVDGLSWSTCNTVVNGLRFFHIPPNIVVTLRTPYDCLEISAPSPHCVSSACET
jgi:integrase/recombinase XerD